MNPSSEVFVTLPAELIRKLREQARIQGIPFLWLVAGLVSDTLESRSVSTQSPLNGGLTAH
jgi:hypothetical protein